MRRRKATYRSTGSPEYRSSAEERSGTEAREHLVSLLMNEARRDEAEGHVCTARTVQPRTCIKLSAAVCGFRSSLGDALVTTPTRPVKRPKARWYLLSVLGLLLALGFFTAGLAATAVNAANTPSTQHGQITLIAGKKFDVFGETSVGDRVSCTFTTVTGGAAFTEHFVVPRQHDSYKKNQHHFLRRHLGLAQNLLGSFTAPRSGRFLLHCANAYKTVNASADEAPPAYIYALFFAALGFATSAVGWTIFLIVRRRRFRRPPWPDSMPQIHT